MADERDKSDRKRLREAIRPVLQKCKDDRIIDPVIVATTVMTSLDETLRNLAAHLEIRQLVRGSVRRDNEAGDNETKRRKREPMFPGFPLIQRRYPTADGMGYIKVEEMSKADWQMNVERLSGKGKKLRKHAAQLRAWGKDRFADDRDTAITG